LVGSLEDELRLWLRLLLGHRQIRPCPSGDHLCHSLVSAAEPVAGRRSARHIVHNIRSGGRLHHRLALAVAVVLHTHTLALHAPDAPRIFIVGMAQALPPQHPLCLDLGAPAAVTATTGSVAGTTRGCLSLGGGSVCGGEAAWQLWSSLPID
jgi:hypothetical protein